MNLNEDVKLPKMTWAHWTMLGLVALLVWVGFSSVKKAPVPAAPSAPAFSDQDRAQLPEVEKTISTLIETKEFDRIADHGDKVDIFASSVFRNTPVDQKESLLRSVWYFYSVKHNGYVDLTVKDNFDGKEIASFSKSRGFEMR